MANSKAVATTRVTRSNTQRTRTDATQTTTTPNPSSKATPAKPPTNEDKEVAAILNPRPPHIPNDKNHENTAIPRTPYGQDHRDVLNEAMQGLLEIIRSCEGILRNEAQAARLEGKQPQGLEERRRKA